MCYNTNMNKEGSLPVGEQVINTEPLSFEETANLVVALDSEPKCTLIVSMQNGIIYSQNDLFTSLMRAQGNAPGWNLSQPTAFGYCTQSLAPIGLVASEVIDGDRGTIGFIKTPFGSKIGTATAGLLLRYSQKNNINLYDLLGNTSSPTPPGTEKDAISEDSSIAKKRAPITRVKMFMALISNDLPMRQTDLAQIIGENKDILSSHLKNLQKRGIISYDSIPSGKAYPEQDGNQFNWATKSRVSLTPKQRECLEEFINIFNGIQKGDESILAEGIRATNHFKMHPEEVGHIMQRAKEASSQGNKSPEKITVQEVMSALQRSQGSTSAEIQQRLEDAGNRLSEQRVRSILRGMRKEGKVVGEKKNQSIKWKLPRKRMNLA
jgi:DNA-binding MarR family transcriptional regulator